MAPSWLLQADVCSAQPAELSWEVFPHGTKGITGDYLPQTTSGFYDSCLYGKELISSPKSIRVLEVCNAVLTGQVWAIRTLD